jgi:hypothetical protein
MLCGCVLAADKDNLHDVSAAIRAQKAHPGSDGAAATPSNALLRLQCVDRESKETIIDLLQGSVDEERKGVRDLPRGSADGKKDEEVMVAVDTWTDNGVWIMGDKGGWVKQADVPEKCRIWGTCICGIPGGFVLLGGKDGNNKVTSKCWIFSYRTNNWEELVNMGTDRMWVEAALVGHCIFAFGGLDDKENVLTVVETLNITTKRWTRAASMPCAMMSPRIAAAGEFVYIKDKMSQLFFSYDTTDNTYTSLKTDWKSVPEEVFGTCMISHNNKLYLLGHERVAIQYDLLTKSWQQLTPPSACYSEGCCAITRDNDILLCGGSTEEDEKIIVKKILVEKYDVATDAWEQLEVRLPFQFYKSHCRVLNYMYMK